MMMKKTIGWTIVLAVLGLGATPPLHAQQPGHGNFGWGVSWMTYAPFLEADADVIPEDLQADGSLAFNVYGEQWFGRSKLVGVNVGAGTSTFDLAYPPDVGNARMSHLDLRGMVRIIGGRAKVMPFLSLGGGLTWYDFDQSLEVGIPGTPVVMSEADNQQWTLLGGAGLDIFPGDSWWWPEIGIRLEAVDHATLGRPFDTIEGQDDDIAHNFRFGIGIQAAPVW
jgi:hypothetical protein